MSITLKLYIHTLASFLRVAMLAITLAIAALGCTANRIVYDMKQNGFLAPCPDTPNCVSSEAQDPRHAVAPMQLAGDSDTEWADVQAVVSRLPRTRIVTATDRYLHVTVKSRFFGFVDDMELMLDPSSGMISIRSASRTGSYDLGVNRRRVENVRKRLKAAELIQ